MCKREHIRSKEGDCIRKDTNDRNQKRERKQQQQHTRTNLDGWNVVAIVMARSVSLRSLAQPAPLLFFNRPHYRGDVCVQPTMRPPLPCRCLSVECSWPKAKTTIKRHYKTTHRQADESQRGYKSNSTLHLSASTILSVNMHTDIDLYSLSFLCCCWSTHTHISHFLPHNEERKKDREKSKVDSAVLKSGRIDSLTLTLTSKHTRGCSIPSYHAFSPGL